MVGDEELNILMTNVLFGEAGVGNPAGGREMLPSR
jgi:hypothetical protein